MKKEFKVCSFNSRLICDSDGINIFYNRQGKIKEFIEKESPDIIGLQEITPEMYDWYVENLTDYYIVGAGRGKDNTDEAAAIAFNKARMRLISCDTVMLSSSPREFGSRYYGSGQSPCPRAYTRALIRHKDIKDAFYVYNVHTDHESDLSRSLAVMQIIQDINSHSAHFFLTGDFNALPNDTPIKLLLENEARKIVDTTASIKESFHGFGNYTPGKIDYIFAPQTCKVKESYKVECDSSDGIYISDHYPICTVFELD